MRKLLIAAGTALLATACASSNMDAEPSQAASDPTDPTSAMGYLAMAASSDMFETESSRLALQMSRNEAVRSFAQMMVSDHMRTTAELQTIARDAGVTPPPPMMMPHHRDMLDRLRAAPATDFDQAYKDAQVMAHQEAITLHNNYADRGDRPAFRDFAARTVPVIRMHYDHAQRLPVNMQAPSAPVQAGERG